MKMIQSGELIKLLNEDMRWGFQFHGNSPPKIEENVTYLFELVGVQNETKTFTLFHLKQIGKKQDFICGDCGERFISHKGLCSTCYVNQL